MKTLLYSFLAFFALQAQAQRLDFDNIIAIPDSFVDGRLTKPNRVFFNENGTTFSTKYDTAFGGYWDGGIVPSSMTDTTDETFANSYSAITARGSNNSLVYAVGSQNSGLRLSVFTIPSVSLTFDSISVTNTTYAYRTMQNGNRIARKFSAVNKDSFVLFIYGYNGGSLFDSVRVDLASFTSANANEHYILKDWKRVSLEKLGFADSLLFRIVSSDVGQFGINTPTNFAIDDLSIKRTTDITKIKPTEMALYPNPTNGEIMVKTEHQKVVYLGVYSIEGMFLLKNQGNYISLSTLSKGTYLIQVVLQDGTSSFQKVQKL